jgi:hypothetical protein
VIKTKNGVVIVNEKLNFTLSATVSLGSTHVERSNEVLLTVSGSRLVWHSDTVLPAALNAVLVSSHGTAECYDMFKFRWAILNST